MQNAVVPPRARRGLAASLLALALTLPACDSGPQTAATVELAVPTNTILVGQSVQITPTVKDKSGKTLLNRPIVYQATTPTVVAVSSTGLVLGLTPGNGVVTATVDGVTESVTLVVAPVPVHHVAMSRDTATLPGASTLQLTATPMDSANHALTDRTVSWTSSDLNVATVSSTGLVTGVATGTATITATAEGKTGTTRVTVTPAAVASIDVTPHTASVQEGRTLQLTATPRDAAGHALTGRTIAWTSADVTKATVSATGLVTGVAPGAANILATSGNIFGSAAVVVTPLVVGSVDISPAGGNVQLGSTLQLTATVKDTAGTVVTSKPVTWTSLDVAIATVDTTGLVTAVAYGAARIVAAAGGRADTVSVSVVGAPVSNISVAPNPADLGRLRTGRFRVILYDAAGNPTFAPVTWASKDTDVVTVDSTGLVKGITLGTTQVYARAGGRLAVGTINVVVTTVANIAITTANATIAVGDSTTLAVTTYAAGGLVLASRLISFSSDHPEIATVDAAGVVRGVSAGTVRISVTSEGVTATFDILVQ